MSFVCSVRTTSPKAMKIHTLMPVPCCESSLALADGNVAVLQSFAVLMASKPSGGWQILSEFQNS